MDGVSKVMDNYWTQEDLDALHGVETYAGLLPIALRVLDRMPRPRALVSGPITTGAGSREANLSKFDAAIVKLRGSDKVVFDQLPFERPMARIQDKEGGGYATHLLIDFYLPIFQEKLVDEIYFLPDWQSSTGASWEHERAKEFGLKIIHL
jgi:hypothetical protein